MNWMLRGKGKSPEDEDAYKHLREKFIKEEVRFDPAGDEKGKLTSGDRWEDKQPAWDLTLALSRLFAGVRHWRSSGTEPRP